MPITTEQYFGQHVPEQNVSDNARLLLARVNTFLEGYLTQHPGPVRMSSGYRSPEHNVKVGGAPRSHHMSGKAIDISDYSRTLAKYCVRYQDQLRVNGLYCEDPRATTTWVHFQDVEPGSKKRFFVPSAKYAYLNDTPLTEDL
jgi:hypothetical protein